MKNNSIIICILKLICEEKQMSNNEYNISGEFKYNNIKNETINTYIQNRLIAQIKWYDKKSLKIQTIIYNSYNRNCYNTYSHSPA